MISSSSILENNGIEFGLFKGGGGFGNCGDRSVHDITYKCISYFYYVCIRFL